MPSFLHLIIPKPIVAGIVARARAALPNECCGLLAGRMDRETGTVAEAFPVENEAASPTEFRTSARDLFAAFRSMRDRGLELLAIYHSHPASEPIPSRRDLEQNTYGETAVHLIVGLGGAEPDIRAWWLGEGSFREAEWTVEG
jgi:proteasome lid subunit RPN8/RPN11